MHQEEDDLWEDPVLKAFGSRLNNVLKAEPTPPKMLYHYTSATGLEGILKSGKIWATHHNYMNDPAEGRDGTLSIHEVLEESTCDLGKLAFKLLNANFGTVEKMRFKDTYLASFSTEGDSLSQWMLYGDRGRGFAIGFDLRDQPCRKVLYNEQKFRELTRQVVNAAQVIWNQVAKNAPRMRTMRQWLKTSCAGLLLNILEWACRYKNETWKQEREWRLRSDPVPFGINDEVRVRVRGSQLVPYRELKLWDPSQVEHRSEDHIATKMGQAPIREIVLGPLQDEAAGRFAAEAIWESFSLQRSKKVSKRGESDLQRMFAKVRKSTIEYRQT